MGELPDRGSSMALEYVSSSGGGEVTGVRGRCSAARQTLASRYTEIEVSISDNRANLRSAWRKLYDHRAGND